MKIDEIYAEKCATPSDINEHLPVLKTYASKCKFVTEFGVRSVVSTWALIAGKPMLVTSYDLVSPGDEMLCQIRSVAIEADVIFAFTQEDTLKADIGMTDMLFVDTFHTATQLRQELNRHADKVKKWIILHDTETFGEKGEADGELGLNPAIYDFLKDHDEWFELNRYTNNNGLTVLKRK